MDGYQIRFVGAVLSPAIRLHLSRAYLSLEPTQNTVVLLASKPAVNLLNVQSMHVGLLVVPCYPFISVCSFHVVYAYVHCA